MLNIILLLITCSVIISVINISETKHFLTKFLITLTLSSGVYFVYPFSLTFNLTKLTLFINTTESLSALSVLLICDAAFTIYLSAIHIRRSENEKPCRLLCFISCMPALSLIPGLIFLQVYIFNNLIAESFKISAMYFSGILFLIFISGSFILNRMYSLKENFRDIRMLLACTQLVISMFLPLINSEVFINKTNFSAEPDQLVQLSVLFGAVMLSGFIFSLISPQKLIRQILKRKIK